ncbi:MAG: hypothetical protein ACF8R7_08520 [Phycisphaerales bacterium JB039]
MTGNGPAADQPNAITTCPRCAYDLAGLNVAKCPECGADVAAEFQRRGAPKRAWPIILAWSLCFLGWGWGALAMQSLYAHYTGSPVSVDPVWMLIHLAAVVSAAGLITSLVFRRGLRTAPLGCYWSLATPGFFLLTIFGIILLLVLAG